MNLTDFVLRGATVNPSGPALLDRQGGCLSHAELDSLSARIADALQNRGIREGTPVAVVSPNDAVAFACVLGIMRAGGTWVTSNYRASASELGDLFRSSGCRLAIAHASVLPVAERAAADTATTAVSLATVGRWADEATLDYQETAWNPDAVAALGATGGTTGNPKLVPTTHRQLHVMCLGLEVHMPSSLTTRLLMAPPMTHAAGAFAYPVLAAGGSVLMHPSVEPAAILEDIQALAVTRTFLPPTALYSLLDHERSRHTDYSSLEHFVLAAAPVSTRRLREARDVIGPVMTQLYGQVEAPMICTFMSPQDLEPGFEDPAKAARVGSCGRPSAVTQVRIIDSDGREVRAGEMGEIAVRSELVMSGYLGDEPGAKQALGWHRTGDIGTCDADGFVYIVDRAKDMIITGGFNVYPNQIEQVINTFDFVADCAVVGLPHEKWGEVVTAVVEPKAGYMIDEAAVLRACRDELGPIKAPKSVIVRTLPRSTAGKVLKRELRDEYWSGLQRRI